MQSILPAVLLFGVGALAWGQPAGPGLPVGASVPSFSLADQNGRDRTRESLSGPKGLMLVFIRSADW